jgi:hypothetical protein
MPRVFRGRLASCGEWIREALPIMTKAGTRRRIHLRRERHAVVERGPVGVQRDARSPIMIALM